MSKSPTTDLRCQSPVHYQLCNGLLWLMAVWIDRVEKLQLLETFKNKLRHAIRQGAITSSKSDVDPCSHGRDPDRQKMWTDGQTDRQTDRQTAFQLYIVDSICPVKNGYLSRQGCQVVLVS